MRLAKGDVWRARERRKKARMKAHGVYEVRMKVLADAGDPGPASGGRRCVANPPVSGFTFGTGPQGREVRAPSLHTICPDLTAGTGW